MLVEPVMLEEHYWFNQHGHGNLRMQARAVPSCMQQACGPFRHRTLHMDSRTRETRRDPTDFHAMVRAAPAGDGNKRKGNKRKRTHLAITRGNWRPAAGTMRRRCWDSSRSNHIHGSTSMVTETCVCKQDTCQAACSTHAGRYVTARFTWPLGHTRPAEMQLTVMP